MHEETEGTEAVLETPAVPEAQVGLETAVAVAVEDLEGFSKQQWAIRVHPATHPPAPEGQEGQAQMLYSKPEAQALLELMVIREVLVPAAMGADSETTETPVVQDQSATTELWAPLAMAEA